MCLPSAVRLEAGKEFEVDPEMWQMVEDLQSANAALTTDVIKLRAHVASLRWDSGVTWAYLAWARYGGCSVRPGLVGVQAAQPKNSWEAVRGYTKQGRYCVFSWFQSCQLRCMAWLGGTRCYRDSLLTCISGHTSIREQLLWVAQTLSRLYLALFQRPAGHGGKAARSLTPRASTSSWQTMPCSRPTA